MYLTFQSLGSGKEREMMNVELLAFTQKGLKKELNTLTSLSLPYDDKQKEGRDFLGRFSGTESSIWGYAVHWSRQRLWFGPEGQVGLLCRCLLCRIKILCPLYEDTS